MRVQNAFDCCTEISFTAFVLEVDAANFAFDSLLHIKMACHVGTKHLPGTALSSLLMSVLASNGSRTHSGMPAELQQAIPVSPGTSACLLRNGKLRGRGTGKVKRPIRSRVSRRSSPARNLTEVTGWNRHGKEPDSRTASSSLSLLLARLARVGIQAV